MLFANDRQVNAIVPYAIAEGEKCQTIDLTIEAGTEILGPFPFNVAEALPGIFTVDGGGFGAAAALNQDGTLNTRANPIRRGEIIVIYATGFGSLTENPQDGSVTSLTGPWPGVLAAFQAFVETGLPGGGASGMEVLYVGPAPGLVSGVIQINARVPESARVGPETQIVVSVGSGLERSHGGQGLGKVTILVE